MKPFLLFGIILISISIQAQVTQGWVARNTDLRFLPPYTNLPEPMVVDKDGNIFLSGWTPDPLNESISDYATVKYNSDGVQQWFATYSFSSVFSDDKATGIAIDSMGNVYVIGQSFGDDTTRYDWATVKYNSSGVQQWVRRYHGPNYQSSDSPVGIAADAQGNIYVTGKSASRTCTIKYSSSGDVIWIESPTNDMAPIELVIDESANIYITGYQPSAGYNSPLEYITIKYNSSGAQEWVKTYNGPGDSHDIPYSITLDDAGNVYVTGISSGVGSSSDYATIKYNYSGLEEWVARYNGPANNQDGAYSIAVNSSGDVYVTGFAFTGTMTESATIKYNSQGIQQWVALYAGPDSIANIARDIALDSEGNIYVTGVSSGQLAQTDYVTIKYNSDGVEQWVQRYDGPSNRNDAYCIALDKNNNVYISGESWGVGNTPDCVTIKYSQGVNITEPQAGEKWIAGETDTIKWTGGQQGQLLDLEYTTDNGNSFSIIQLGVLAESLSYEWTIPSNLLSTKIKIRLRDVIDTLISVTSDSFRVKPYIITKVNANGDYIAYDRVTDVWNFANYPEHMWPMDWYSQFDYQGIDPFTGSNYSQLQCDFFFASSLSSEHMDWVSWVNAFGVNFCYHSTIFGIYNYSALLKWEAKNSEWNGSCFGIAASNALAFSVKDQFLEAYQGFPSFFSPITVMSDTGVKRVVNELFTHQFGNPSKQARIGRWNAVTPNQTLNEVKSMLREDSVKIRTLSLWNNNGAGGHSILVYGLEQDETQKELYYLFVYDNSYPTINNALILIDTTGNSNQGTWLTTYAWATWGGPTKLMLEIPSVNYLTDPILPKKGKDAVSPFILENEELEINTSLNANTHIIDIQGNITGYNNGIVIEEIPSSVPLMYLNGSETPPYGYSLPTENYSVVLNEFTEDTVETFFFSGNKSFVYERSGADQTQTDRLFFDGGVSATNPDAQTKTIKLLNLVNETSQEKLAVVRSLELAQNDSVKIENPDSNKVKLISYGTAKNFDLELNYVTENGIGRFVDFNISLDANTSHTFIPVWTDITNTELKVLVDIGNDGTIDDTLSLINQVTGIGEDQGTMLIPNSYNLAQNYPNPFNPTTKISWQTPVGSHQTLKVYGLLGNEVATLVDEYREAGRYEVEFNATKYPSGVYFYRLQAGSFVETKKMILLK